MGCIPAQVWLAINAQVLQDITVHCDNVGLNILTRDPSFHTRMKHIDIQHHYVCERIEASDISYTYTPSHDNLADCLTKPLPCGRAAPTIPWPHYTYGHAWWPSNLRGGVGIYWSTSGKVLYCYLIILDILEGMWVPVVPAPSPQSFYLLLWEQLRWVTLNHLITFSNLSCIM